MYLPTPSAEDLDDPEATLDEPTSSLERITLENLLVPCHAP